MRISEIYDTYAPGSDEFVAAVQKHCAYDISADEIRRIAGKAMSGEAFDYHWSRESWWRDEMQGEADE